jgi:two-component system, OmpR family, phosphate regulon sensor histidine kinase PhoR
MKHLRFRTKLLIYFWVVLVIALFLPTTHLYRALETEILKEAETHADTQLDFVAWMLGRQPVFNDDATLDQWITALGKNLNYRITLISWGGRVMADSDVDFSELSVLDSHADREEFIGAVRGGRSSSIRYSTTLNRNLIYAARSLEATPYGNAVLRVAIPLSRVETRLGAIADRFWLILGFFLVLTGILNYLLARNLETPIRKIIEAARRIGGGNYHERIEVSSSVEFEELSACINEMTEKIRRHIDLVQQQKQEFEAVFEGMQEGVMLLDATGHIKASNNALALIARCMPTCEGHRPMEVFLNPEIQKACDEVLAGKDHIQMKAAIDAETIYEVNVVRIPSGGAVVVFHDISDLVHLEKVRQDFVANVSHELRTPLTSIKGYAETLLDPKLRSAETMGSFLGTILKNANQMSNIVNDLLELTKLQSRDRPALALAEINASTCFAAAEETCRIISQEKNIRIVNQMPEIIPVIAEENALVMIFRNLLDNAIRHSDDGTTVTAGVSDVNGMVTFALEDEGPGIPLRHQKRIFERFYRIDKERSRASGGTGLGLAICRHATKVMGGDIWVESPPPGKTKGSVFFVTLKKANRK